MSAKKSSECADKSEDEMMVVVNGWMDGVLFTLVIMV